MQWPQTIKTTLLVITLIISLFCSSNIYAINDVPENNMSYPVFIEGDKSMGSGVFLSDENYFYLVTAKHVLFDKINGSLTNKKVNLISYRGSLDERYKSVIAIELLELYNADLIRVHPKQDLAIIRLGKIRNFSNGTFKIDYEKYIKSIIQGEEEGHLISASINNIKSFDDTIVGNNIYLFGYPASIGLEKVPQVQRDIPLLRRGIVAGKNQKLRTIIIDSPVYFGNSGGPVIMTEQNNLLGRNFYLIGIVIEFIPFTETWFNNRYNTHYTNLSNSGYSVVAPIDAIKDILWHK